MTSKKIFIILMGFILSVSLITLLIFIFKSDSSRPTLEEIIIDPSAVTFVDEGVSIVIPEKWDTFAYKDAEDGLTSFWQEDATTFLNVSLRLEKIQPMPTLEAFRKDNSTYDVRLMSDGESIYYSGDPPIEDLFEGKTEEEIDSVEGYIVGSLSVHDEGFVSVECRVQGSTHANFTSVCDDIVDSLKIY